MKDKEKKIYVCTKESETEEVTKLVYLTEEQVEAIEWFINEIAFDDYVTCKPLEEAYIHEP